MHGSKETKYLDIKLWISSYPSFLTLFWVVKRTVSMRWYHLRCYQMVPSHWDCSFDYVQHMFWLRNIFFIYRPKVRSIYTAYFKMASKEWAGKLNTYSQIRAGSTHLQNSAAYRNTHTTEQPLRSHKSEPPAYTHKAEPPAHTYKSEPPAHTHKSEPPAHTHKSEPPAHTHKS